jgi:hypothetical protein
VTLRGLADRAGVFGSGDRGTTECEALRKGSPVLVFGSLLMLASAGAGTLLVWDNRNVIVHVRVLDVMWTGHLYTVLEAGALLACWFLLGASFVRYRVVEGRRRRAARAVPSVAAVPVAEPAPFDDGERAAQQRPARLRARRRGRPTHAV